MKPRAKPAQALEPDVYVPFTATMPKRLIAAIDERARSLGLSRAAYLVSLARADLIAAGIEPPTPPPPKRNGPRPTR
jgi:hypothetical protein